jgi:aspartyl-tRNA(Asn)/glutamyl-tRNA(Gln) amidotransferase subunit A
MSLQAPLSPSADALADMPLHALSLAQASALIRQKTITPVQLVQAYIERIERLDGQVNAFVTPTLDAALQMAHQASREIAQGQYRGALHGIPMAHKDVYLTQGVRTTAHSRHLQDWVPSVSATLVTGLERLGVISLGKTACHEFAFGSPSEDDVFPPARNPWHLAHMPGSSSSGSGAAVTAGLCLAATGTDTGGSIRHPAAACGVVGLKPTRQAYPMSGVIALAPSLDVAGFLTRTALDQALIWDAWHGSDVATACTADVQRSVLHGLRIGVPAGLWCNADNGQATHDPQIQACFDETLQTLQAQGAQVVTVQAVDWPAQPEVVQTANTLIAFEAFQQLQHIWRDHPEQLGQGLRQKLAAAAQLSWNNYHAARVQADVWQQQVSVLLSERVDVLMWPGREALPETLQALMANPTGQRSACNRLFSLTGHPALTCPMGVSTQGLPMALQIGAALHGEGHLLQVAHAVTSAIGWRLPVLLD